MSQISNRACPRNYLMNPKTEYLVRGSDLEEGMVVLVESPTVRSFARTMPQKSDYEYPRFRETRYWCQVTNLVHHTDPDLIKFIGVYSDGRQASRTYHQDYCWIVRK